MYATMRSVAVAALLLAGQATAHMKMAHPVPFGVDSLDTSPLEPVKPGTTQSDYPCKNKRADVYKISTMNNMAVNDEIPLSFNGSASHGGGTCQIAVTLDKEPTVDSVFKVIQVFEGGCPSSRDGNLGSDDYTFKIPAGFPNGQASLAWVWYNKIGNREVYMNCAPITVTGGSDSKDTFNSLPSLYLINLPASECGTQDTSDVVVPNPGKNVVTGKDALFKAPTGPSCAASAAAQTAGLSGYQTATSGSNDTQTASSTASEVYTTSAPLTYGGGAPTIITIATSAPAYSATSSAAAPTSAPASYPTLTPSSGAGIYGPGTATGTAAAPAGTGSSSGSASGSVCSTNGALICNGATQFGLCDNGKVVWQAVAAGTTCTNGQIMKRSAMRHAHVRRHAQNGGFKYGA